MFLDLLQRQNPIQQQLTQIRRIPLHCGSQRSAAAAARPRDSRQHPLSHRQCASPTPGSRDIPGLGAQPFLGDGRQARQAFPEGERASPTAYQNKPSPTATHPRSSRALHPKQKLAPPRTAGGGGGTSPGIPLTPASGTQGIERKPHLHP